MNSLFKPSLLADREFSAYRRSRVFKAMAKRKPGDAGWSISRNIGYLGVVEYQTDCLIVGRMRKFYLECFINYCNGLYRKETHSFINILAVINPLDCVYSSLHSSLFQIPAFDK